MGKRGLNAKEIAFWILILLAVIMLIISFIK